MLIMPVCFFFLSNLPVQVILRSIPSRSHTVRLAYDSARTLYNPAGLIDGSTCDTEAKTVRAKCGHHGEI